ncbi:hypothetical protein PFMC_02220 [Plasmodium falciparum CAMP/Malaysia]|uniref:Uncharacterized protein n=1 Tax=Plasmodium falciparum (isolate Camp / Malaysia) TaxID=5835 RepID=A0A024X9F9_PLAFC|nr:hypothetical protein PFMC_02220 [Plasmodium falciparum CAMP/Malaysia]
MKIEFSLCIIIPHMIILLNGLIEDKIRITSFNLYFEKYINVFELFYKCNFLFYFILSFHMYFQSNKLLYLIFKKILCLLFYFFI